MAVFQRGQGRTGEVQAALNARGGALASVGGDDTGDQLVHEIWAQERPGITARLAFGAGAPSLTFGEAGAVEAAGWRISDGALSERIAEARLWRFTFTGGEGFRHADVPVGPPWTILQCQTLSGAFGHRLRCRPSEIACGRSFTVAWALYLWGEGFHTRIKLEAACGVDAWDPCAPEILLRVFDGVEGSLAFDAASLCIDTCRVLTQAQMFAQGGASAHDSAEGFGAAGAELIIGFVTAPTTEVVRAAVHKDLIAPAAHALLTDLQTSGEARPTDILRFTESLTGGIRQGSRRRRRAQAVENGATGIGRGGVDARLRDARSMGCERII